MVFFIQKYNKTQCQFVYSLNRWVGTQKNKIQNISLPHIRRSYE